MLTLEAEANKTRFQSTGTFQLQLNELNREGVGGKFFNQFSLRFRNNFHLAAAFLLFWRPPENETTSSDGKRKILRENMDGREKRKMKSYFVNRSLSKVKRMEEKLEQISCLNRFFFFFLFSFEAPPRMSVHVNENLSQGFFPLMDVSSSIYLSI